MKESSSNKTQSSDPSQPIAVTRTTLSPTPVWAKAALLGSLWASAEIIIGSFLHNLNIPFAGTVLAAVGICLLVAGQVMWKTPGLIWRAGLVCALMKSVSPSAIIITPMIGIFTEALILEFTVRIFGVNTVGLIIGGGIALCLPLVHFVLKLLILFGFNIAELYVRFYDQISRFLNIENINAWELLGLVLVLNLCFGVAVSVFGFVVGRRTVAGRYTSEPNHTERSSFHRQEVPPTQRFSIWLLLLHIGMIPVLLLIIRSLPLLGSAGLVIIYVLFTIKLYPASWKRLNRPKLWLIFASITVLAGLLLGELSDSRPGWQWGGAVAGLEMTLRALFIIAAFNAVSVELRNPRVVTWLSKKGFGQLARALEIGFEALPAMIGSLGEEKKIFCNPVASMSRLLSAARHWLESFDARQERRYPVFILTGERGSGKTSALLQLADMLKEDGYTVGGIVTPGMWLNGKRESYEVLDIHSGERHPLCRRTETDSVSEIQAGLFSFDKNGIDFGCQVLNHAMDRRAEAILVDEAGPLELKGLGWAPLLDRLFHEVVRPVIVTIRESLVPQIVARWNLEPVRIWKADTAAPQRMFEEIRSIIDKSSPDAKPESHGTKAAAAAGNCTDCN